MDESNIEEGRLNSILKSRNRFPLHEVQGFFPEDDTVTTTFTRNRRVSFGRKCVKEFQIGSAVSTQALDEYEQSASFSDPSECSGPLDLALNKTSRDAEPEESNVEGPITPPECFSDSKQRAPEDRARLFTENCISIAKSVFQDTETELTAIIIGAKPTSNDDERKNISSMNFSTHDISHDFVPVRHPELLFSEQTHHVDKSRFEFLDHPASNKLGMKPSRPVLRTPLARISTPWDGENDENIPPAHRAYRQASTPLHRDFLSNTTMEFTCANMKANHQQFIHTESFNCSDMEETRGRMTVNNTQRSLDMSCTRGACNNLFTDDEDDDDDPLKLDEPRDDFLAELSGLDTDKSTEDSPFGSIQKELANLSVANKSFRDRFEISANNRSIVFSPAPATPQVLSPCEDPLLFTPTCPNIRVNQDDMEITEARVIPPSTPGDSCDVSTVLTPCSALPFSPTCVNMQLKPCENDMEITEVVRGPFNQPDDSILANSIVISPNGPITPLKFSPTCTNFKLLTQESKEEDIKINEVRADDNNVVTLKDSGVETLNYAATPMRKSETSPAKEINFVIIESSHETSERSKVVENSSENRVEIESIEFAHSRQSDDIVPENVVDMDVTQNNHTKCSEMIIEILPDNIISEQVIQTESCIAEVNSSKIVVESKVNESVSSDCVKNSEADKESEIDMTQVNHVGPIVSEAPAIDTTESSEGNKECEMDITQANHAGPAGSEIPVLDGTRSSEVDKESEMDITQVNHVGPIVSETPVLDGTISAEGNKECEMDITQVNHAGPVSSEISVLDSTISAEGDKGSEMDMTQVNHAGTVVSEAPAFDSTESSEENKENVMAITLLNHSGPVGSEIPVLNRTNGDIGNDMDITQVNNDGPIVSEVLALDNTKSSDGNEEIDMDIPHVNHPEACAETLQKMTELSGDLSEGIQPEKSMETYQLNLSKTPDRLETNKDTEVSAMTHSEVNETSEKCLPDNPTKANLNDIENAEMNVNQFSVVSENIMNKFNKSVHTDESGIRSGDTSEVNHNMEHEIKSDFIADKMYSNAGECIDASLKCSESDKNKTIMEQTDLEKSQLSPMEEIKNSQKEETESLTTSHLSTLNISTNDTETAPYEETNPVPVDVLNLTSHVSAIMGDEKSVEEFEQVNNKFVSENKNYTFEEKENQTNEVVCDDMEITMSNYQNEKVAEEADTNPKTLPDLLSEKDSDPNKEIPHISTVAESNSKVGSQDETSSFCLSKKDAARKSIVTAQNYDLELGIQRLEITEPEGNTHGDSEQTYTLKSNCEKTYTVELNNETEVLENSVKNKRQTYVISEKRSHSDSPCPNQRLKKNRMSESPVPLRRSARLDASLNRSQTENKQLSTPKYKEKNSFSKRMHSDSPLIGDDLLKKGRLSSSPLVIRNLSTLMDNNDMSYAGPTRFSANLETSITLQDCSIENDSEKELSIASPEDNVVSSTMDKYPTSPELSESVTENVSPQRRNNNVSYGVHTIDIPIVRNKPSFIIEEDIQNEVAMTVNTLRENSITVPNLAIPYLEDEDFAFEHDISSSTRKIDDLLKKSNVLNDTYTDNATITNLSIIDEILKLPHSIDFPNISIVNSTRNMMNKTNCTENDADLEMEGIENDADLEMEGIETELFEQTYKNVRAILEEQSKTNNCNYQLLQLPTGELNAISIEFPLLEAGLILQVNFDKSSKITSLKTLEKSSLSYQTKIKTHINAFGFNFLKNLIKNQEEKLKCLEELPMFIDLFSGFAKKLVDVMKDGLTVLKGCASAELRQHILSFRLNYYMPFTSCLVDVDLYELAMFGQPSINLRHEMGRMSEHTIRQLVPKPQQNLLQVFVKAATNYTIDLEDKTGFVTKRPQLLF